MALYSFDEIYTRLVPLELAALNYTDDLPYGNDEPDQKQPAELTAERNLLVDRISGMIGIAKDIEEEIRATKWLRPEDLKTFFYNVLRCASVLLDNKNFLCAAAAMDLTGYAVAHGGNAAFGLTILEKYEHRVRCELQILENNLCEELEEIGSESEFSPELVDACSKTVGTMLRTLQEIYRHNAEDGDKVAALKSGSESLAQELTALLTLSHELLTRKAAEGTAQNSQPSPTEGPSANLQTYLRFKKAHVATLFTTAARIRPAIGHPERSNSQNIFHQKASAALNKFAQVNFLFFRELIVNQGGQLVHSAEFPGALAVITDVYDTTTLSLLEEIKLYKEDGEKDSAFAVAHSLAKLDSEILVAFHDIPSLCDRASERFREHWRLLRSISKSRSMREMKETKKLFMEVPPTLLTRVGVSQLLALMDELAIPTPKRYAKPKTTTPKRTRVTRSAVRAMPAASPLLH